MCSRRRAQGGSENHKTTQKYPKKLQTTSDFSLNTKTAWKHESKQREHQALQLYELASGMESAKTVKHTNYYLEKAIIENNRVKL